MRCFTFHDCRSILDVSEREDSESQESQPLKKKRPCGRKPSFRPAYLPSLRIVKTDIRRKYGDMICNVENSLNPDLIRRFYKEFCVPNCSYVMNNVTGNTLFEKLVNLLAADSIGSADEIANGTILCGLLFPDTVTILEGYQIRIIQGVSGSQLVGKFQCRSTVMYELTLPDENTGNKGNYNHDTARNDEENAHKEPMINVPPFLFEFEWGGTSHRIPLQLLSNPIETILSYNFVIHLDETNRFTSFQYQFLQ